MGTSRTASDLAAKLQAASDKLPTAARLAVAEGALLVKAAVAEASGQYANSPLARVKITLTGAEALVAMASRKAHLLDHDTAAHDITARRAEALTTPYGLYRTVHHPDTHGKLMWERGVEASVVLVQQTVDTRLGATLLKVFGT